MQRPLQLALAALLCTLPGCKSAPTPQKATTPTVSKPHVLDASARAEDARLAAAHPPFKLFLQKIDLPTILVVAEDATDDQLKDLLWYLRTEVRSGHFKALSLQPTATLYGKPGYTSGNFSIYRGPRCAREMYTASGPDPCGSSLHFSASYHWGDGANPRSDQGDLVTASGATTEVFNAQDGWQTEEEAQRDPDGTLAQATAHRIKYAIDQTAKQTKQRPDIRLYIDQPDDELTIQYWQFADDHSRETFLTQFNILEGDHLCALGFKSVHLAARNQPGKSYPIPCPQAK